MALNMAAELPVMHCDCLEFGIKTAYTDWFVRDIDDTPTSMCVKYVDNGKNPLIALCFRPGTSLMTLRLESYVDAAAKAEPGYRNPIFGHIDLSGASSWRLSNDVEAASSLRFTCRDWDHDAECTVLTFMVPLNLMSGEESKWKTKKARKVLDAFREGRITAVHYKLGHQQRTRFMAEADIPLPTDFPAIISALTELHKHTK